MLLSVDIELFNVTEPHFELLFGSGFRVIVVCLSWALCIGKLEHKLLLAEMYLSRDLLVLESLAANDKGGSNELRRLPGFYIVSCYSSSILNER